MTVGHRPACRRVGSIRRLGVRRTKPNEFVFAHSGNDLPSWTLGSLEPHALAHEELGSARGALTCNFFPEQAGGRKAPCLKSPCQQVAGIFNPSG